MSSCKIEFPIPIINILLNNEKKYVFVGDVSLDIKKILRKIEFGSSISSNEEKFLKKELPTLNYKNVNKFIYDLIRLDDTTILIKNKIFLYLSDPLKDIFYEEGNQELWIDSGNERYKIIGYKYINRETKELLKYKPSIYEKFEVDKDFLDKENPKYELLKENYILFDLIDVLDKNEYTIHVRTIDNLIDKIGKDKINEDIINGYIKKYFPEVNLSRTSSEILKIYKEKLALLEKENKIINFINEVKINEDEYSKGCNITNFRVLINQENDENEEEFIDLLKIFNYLRENLNEEIPFIKYKDDNWDKPYSIVHEDSIKKKYIDQKKLLAWLFIKSSESTFDIKTTRGLIIKQYLYERDGIRYYSNITIYKNGKIDYLLNYTYEKESDMNDVIKDFNNLKTLLKKINELDYTLPQYRDKKIELPNIKFENGILYLSKNVKIMSLGSIINFEKNNLSDIKKFLDFSDYFSPYLSKRDEKKNKVGLIYKRVSNFTNMNEIYKYITQQLSFSKSKYNIIQEIIKEFDIQESFALKIYDEYEEKYLKYGYIMRTIGIAILVEKSTQKIKLNNAENYYVLINAINFMKKLLYVYNYQDNFLKEKTFKEILRESNKYTNISISNDLKDILKQKNINTTKEISLENTEDELLEKSNINVSNVDVDYAKYLNLEVVNNSKTKNIITEEETNNDIPEEIKKFKEGLARDSELDPSVRLSCETAIPELDMCRDLCSDRSYFLRRLQRYDVKLFKYDSDSKKIAKYSKKCQANADIQPVVMKNNPENDPSIDRDSFTYTLKYGSSLNNMNYYICPKVWCPYCQKPKLFEKIKNIKKTRAIGDKACYIGDCPDGDHQVYVMSKKFYKGADGKYLSGLYPGFSGATNPDGMCLPCCFSKPQNEKKNKRYAHFKKCLGETIEDNLKNSDDLYILGENTFLQNGRYGLLPKDLNKLFGNEDIDQGTIKKSCFLKKGIEYVENKNLLACIADISSTNTFKQSISAVISRIKKYLDEKLFKSLNNGTIELIFKNIDNYITYLNSDEFIDETFLWDVLSRPNILFTEGTNIIFFNDVNILCPIGLNSQELFDLSKKTIFIIKEKKYYNPIYYINISDQINIVRYFDSSNEYVAHIINIIKNKCIEFNTINWKKILKNNEDKYKITYHIDINKELSLKQTIKELEKLKKINILSQLIDNYNKCVAVLLSNNLYLPVKPSAIIINIPYENIRNVNLITYDDAIDKLKYIYNNTNISCQPIYKIVNDDNKIIAIQLSTDRIIPIKPSIFKRDSIESKYIPFYIDADNKINEGIQINDKRIEISRKIDYEFESYQRIRFELSKYLLNHKKIFEDIKNILYYSNDPYIEKKNKLKIIIKDILNNIIHVSNRNINWNTYEIPNFRSVCHLNQKKESSKDIHCIEHNGKYKLHIFDKNLIVPSRNNLQYYTNMLIEELLNNRIKREDILSDKISNIINKTKLEKLDGEVIFFGKLDEDLFSIQSLYSKKKYELADLDKEIYDRLDPKYIGINSEYIITDKFYDDYSKYESLSSSWNKILPDSFKVFKNNEGTLFPSFSKILNYFDKKREDLYDAIKLKRILIDFEFKQDDLLKISNDLKIPFESNDNSSYDLLLKLYKNYDKKHYKDINSIIDLKNLILSKSYQGNLIDLYLLSIIFKINIFILNKRIKQDEIGYKFIKNNDYKLYALFYSQIIKDSNIYEVIESESKYMFNEFELPERFRDYVSETMNNKKKK